MNEKPGGHLHKQRADTNDWERDNGGDRKRSAGGDRQQHDSGAYRPANRSGSLGL